MKKELSWLSHLSLLNLVLFVFAFPQFQPRPDLALDKFESGDHATYLNADMDQSNTQGKLKASSDSRSGGQNDR
jgi:hypothetical protein